VKRLLYLSAIAGVAACLFWAFAPAGRADESYAKVAEEVNQKLVKVFGLGGFRGLESYCAGACIGDRGRVLTINSHILDTRDLRVHTHDGTRYRAKVIARDPELDVALIEIEFPGGKVDEAYRWFDYDAAAKRPPVTPGTPVLAFTNMFQLALRDDMLTVQHGTVAAYSRLYGRIGVFEAAYRGNVYVLDAITNNPGSGGGVVTTRKGELVALIGKELRNELTNTWINYAVPLNATAEGVDEKGNKKIFSIPDMVREGPKYRPSKKPEKSQNQVYTGIILVPNVVERTPPYVEEIVPGSPAAASKEKMEPDDLIVYVDGIPVPDINTLNNVLGTYRPGADIKLEVQRGDKLITVPIKLGKPLTAPTPPKKD
jgi:serine protease Do